MKVIIDIECDSITPKHIWCIVAKDIDNGKYYIFRNVTEDEEEAAKFLGFSKGIDLYIGHNILGFDIPVLNRLLCTEDPIQPSRCTDTLIISKMADYSRGGHALADFGIEFGLEKIDFKDWSKWSQAMEDYCIRDVDINYKVYKKYIKFINNPSNQRGIRTEHDFQYLVVNALERNGFGFNRDKASKLLQKVEEQLAILDKDILTAFPPRSKLIKEVVPKGTKFGTISLSSIPKALRSQIEFMSVGEPFSYFKYEEFNPSSHKQIINVLNEAGWKPIDKTQTHIETERELNKLKFTRQRTKELDLSKSLLDTKLQQLRRVGWKVNETNLDTLPLSAPEPARFLARRILLESRRRTLTEWLALVRPNGRIHGKFYGIGAWTQRMAHQNPNTANIPNEFDTQGKKKLYGKELRSMWIAPKNRLLVGVDAEGIQLRIFAHYINDPEFTKALVEGKKEDKSDPHSLNQSILGDVCKSRAAAKRYIYALLLGAGAGKLKEILDCDEQAANQAYERLLKRYSGFAELKETIIPADAKRGWFAGLDGRSVPILGDTVGARRHLAMSGYLQNGEAVVIKTAALIAHPKLSKYESFFVDIIHDEYQVETPNNVAIAIEVGNLLSDAIRQAGEEFNLRCPLAGSFWDPDHKDYTMGVNWAQTH